MRKIHRHTQNFASAAGLTINPGKTVTFGHNCPQDTLPSIETHEDVFKLTGAVVKVTQKNCWTERGPRCPERWMATTQAIRSLPVEWFAETPTLQQRIPQVSWGHGTHKLAFTKPELRTMRANTVRRLLNADDYCASPLMIFTILAPPSLDPEFCWHFSAMRATKRSLDRAAHLQKFTGFCK